jgi:16S rRNA processing protein RimM
MDDVGPIDASIIVVGRIGAPFGVRGWCHLQSYTTPAENILAYAGWHIRRTDGSWTPFKVAAVKPHKQAFVVQVDGITDRDDVAALRGALVGVARTELPPPDAGEFYWQDLVGCEVYTTEAVPLGTIQQMLETGAHDVMVIAAANDEEHLIPFIDPYLVEVDIKARRITVAWEPDW